MPNPHDELNSIIHDALRRDLGRLQAVAEQPQPAARRAAVRDHGTWILDVLHHHHVGEDEGVWPRVLAKRPDLKPVVAEMESEHEALASASDTLRSTLVDYGEGRSDESALRQAVEQMRAATLPHLDHEEQELMPIVLDTLDEADWKYLEKHHFRKGVSFADQSLTAMWWLDDLDESRVWAVRGTIPAPALWFMQRRYGPRYRSAAQSAWGSAA